MARNGETGLYPHIKRLLDFSFAATGLCLTSPVLLAVAVAVRLDSPGPIIFRQERVGQGGRRFVLFKFRTMLHGSSADPNTGDVLKDAPLKPDDHRITRTGRILRGYGLDELPQLWNVVRGDMSLVGPRPTIPEQVERYTTWELRRLEVPQGITGFAQISGRTALAWTDRIKLDIQYVEKRSIREDLRLIYLTVVGIIRGRLHP